MSRHYRQGDVLLMKVDGLPDGAVKDSFGDNIVLAWGEVTGHSHRLTSSDCITLYVADDQKIVEITQPGQVIHEEHNLIDLEPGLYKVVIQREYSPERIRPVVD